MCIIAANTAGGALPSNDTIATMWGNNPDGAGIMWADNGQVHILRGLMTLDALLDAVHRMPAGAAYAIHCRIGTSGGIRPEMCHPWPVSSDPDTLRALSWSGPCAIAHNGVIAGLGDRTRSDTYELVQQIAAPLLDLSGDLSDPRAVSILRTASSGSRLAILDGHGELTLTGEGWTTDSSGVHYSNGTYKLAPAVMWAWSGLAELDDYSDERYDGWCDDEWCDLVPLWDSGAYVLDERGDLYEGDDYAIGPDDLVHVLDYGIANCERWIACPDLRAYTSAGVPLSYDKALELDARGVVPW